MYLIEIFTIFAFIQLVIKLLASLSKLDVVNLQLSMRLSWIFSRTPLPFLLVTPGSFVLILTLKLMYHSLFSDFLEWLHIISVKFLS